MSEPSDTRLRLLTLNCWGLKYIAKFRTERITAIAKLLASSDYDIIALQELWVYSDYEFVRNALQSAVPERRRLKHSKFFYSGALGSGLVIFSRFPIIAATVHSYSLNGSPIDIGDWFVGKAAASVLIAHPILGQVQVFNTHLYAKGGDEGPEHYKAHRLVNAWEFAKLARQAAQIGRYVIAAGDFNSVPTTLPMKIIRDHAGLTDSWVATHPNTPDPSLANPPSPDDAITIHGVTADSPLNTFSAGKPLEPLARKFQGKRLDYIFYRQPSTPHAGPHTPVLRAVDTRVVLTERVPGYSFSYSDHFGMEATFVIETPQGGDVADPDNLYTPTPMASKQSLPSVLASQTNPQPGQLDVAPESITRALTSLTARFRFSKSQASLQLTVFLASLVVVIGIAAASAWFPLWFNPVAIVLTVALAWLGTTALYIGFVYGNWEERALMNIIEELEIYRDALEKR